MSLRVLVLGGGPDAERQVSLDSAAAVAQACGDAGLATEVLTIDAPSQTEIATWPDGVVFPVLHGRWGEGGPLQALLEASGRPFVGCGSRAAALAMDKLGTKLHAARQGVPTAPAAVLDPRDPACPMPFPVVVKPNRDGSSVGVHLCRDQAGYDHARAEAAEHPDTWMVEALVTGQELTVGVLDGGDGTLRALPPVEIAPAEGFYDHEAKYQRSDTRYTVDPDLPEGVRRRVSAHAERLARSMNLRHLSRVDLLLDGEGREWLLEVNTMPGFTGSSLLPMAAAETGLRMPELVSRLVRLAAGAAANG
ncbi:MAG: D-alanine--D-alanine ligase [Planctomycetota bacterium]